MVRPQLHPLFALRRSLPLWVRTPLIPGAAADPAVLNAIGDFLRNELGGAVDRWELCAFNPSCSAKYRRLGLEWEYPQFGLQTEVETDALLSVARTASGLGESVRLQGLRCSTGCMERAA